jgi:hypothetical protein
MDIRRGEACLAPVPTGNSRRERSRGEREGEACLAPTNMVRWHEEIQALWNAAIDKVSTRRARHHNNFAGETHAAPQCR